MKHMLSSALVAGFAAGLLCALLQFLLVQPKIVLAERYEAGELVHFQGLASPEERAAAMAHAMPDMDMTAEGSEHHGARRRLTFRERLRATRFTRAKRLDGFVLRGGPSQAGNPPLR